MGGREGGREGEEFIEDDMGDSLPINGKWLRFEKESVLVA